MTTIFQITVAIDEVNRKYGISAFDTKTNSVTTDFGTLNKVWRTIGERIKAAEKQRVKFPLEPPKQIETNGGDDSESSGESRIIIAGV